MTCRGCLRAIPPAHDARFCDDAACGESWPVCRRCAPPSLDPRALRCPAHQLAASPPPEPPGGSRGALFSSQSGTLARVVARVWARASAQPPELLAASPLDGDQGHAALLLDCEAAILEAWPLSRRADLLGPVRRLYSFAAYADLLSLPSSQVDRLLLLYARARCFRPLAGWAAVSPRTVAGELSRLATALREELPDIPPSGGPSVRAFLAAQGASARPQHTQKLPVTPRDVVGLVSPLSGGVRLLGLAVVLQSFYALRPGYVATLRRADFTSVRGGWMLSWRQAHKTRRAPSGLPPQTSIARHRLIDEALAAGSDTGPLFPRATAAAITSLLRSELPAPPPDFTLSAHGVRAGTDAALQALGVPDDVIAAWGWWARARRMTAYYGSINISICLVASDLLPLVEIRPVAPGWYAPVYVPATPSWSSVGHLTPVAPPASPVAFGVVSSSDEDGVPHIAQPPPHGLPLHDSPSVARSRGAAPPPRASSSPPQPPAQRRRR